MTDNEFRKSVLDTALALGCDAAETVFVEGDSFRVGILAQEIDSYSVSRQFGIGLRVQADGRNGYAYTEKLDDPEALCRRALDNARVIGSTDDHPMQGPQTYVAVTAPENPVCEKSEREKIELAMGGGAQGARRRPACGACGAQHALDGAYHRPYHEHART